MPSPALLLLLSACASDSAGPLTGEQGFELSCLAARTAFVVEARFGNKGLLKDQGWARGHRLEETGASELFSVPPTRRAALTDTPSLQVDEIIVGSDPSAPGQWRAGGPGGLSLLLQMEGPAQETIDDQALALGTCLGTAPGANQVIRGVGRARRHTTESAQRSVLLFAGSLAMAFEEGQTPQVRIGGKRKDSRVDVQSWDDRGIRLTLPGIEVEIPLESQPLVLQQLPGWSPLEEAVASQMGLATEREVRLAEVRARIRGRETSGLALIIEEH